MNTTNNENGRAVFSQQLNGSNYIVWKFQTRQYMKGRGLLDNIEGKTPDENASPEIKSQYDRNDGKATFALIQSVDSRHANMIVSCQSAKEIVDKFANAYEKNSEIRVMTLYEDYFALKMKEDDKIIDYISKVNRIADEIEQQGEKLSEKLKMFRIIGSLSSKINNYKTVWYNTKDSRTLDTLMSALQLEEEHLNRNQGQDEASIDQVTFVAAKSQKGKGGKKPKSKGNIDEIKKRTRCHICKDFGHWVKECPKKKSSSNEKRDDNVKKQSAWCSIVKSTESVNSNVWFVDSGASSHMTYHRI